MLRAGVLLLPTSLGKSADFSRQRQMQKFNSHFVDYMVTLSVVEVSRAERFINRPTRRRQVSQTSAFDSSFAMVAGVSRNVPLTSEMKMRRVPKLVLSAEEVMQYSREKWLSSSVEHGHLERLPWGKSSRAGRSAPISVNVFAPLSMSGQ